MSDIEIAADPDATRLLERIVDKLDAILVKQGFEFREDKAWEDSCAVIEKWIFTYYDDLAGGDSDYDPKKPLISDSSDVEVEGEVSSDEDEEEIELESSSEQSVSPAVKKHKK